MTKLVILLLFYWDKCTHFNGMSAIVCGLCAAMCQCGKAGGDRWLLRLFEYVFWCWTWHEIDWLLHPTFTVKICRKVHSYLVNLAVVASWMGNVKLTLFRGHQVSASISFFFVATSSLTVPAKRVFCSEKLQHWHAQRASKKHEHFWHDPGEFFVDWRDISLSVVLLFFRRW